MSSYVKSGPQSDPPTTCAVEGHKRRVVFGQYAFFVVDGVLYLDWYSTARVFRLTPQGVWEGKKWHEKGDFAPKNPPKDARELVRSVRKILKMR